ncbi:MAG: hypothetical protein ACK5LP_09410 [Campylobacteraceae bacterium]
MFYFYGCANSGATPMSISLNQVAVDKATFSASNCFTEVPLRYISSSNYPGRLSVKRSFYHYGKDVIIHERIWLDNNFVYSVGLDSVIYAGFEFKQYKKTSIGDFHTYFEGLSRTNTPIYVIAGGVGVFEDIFTIYSENKEVIQNLATCIKEGKQSEQLLPKDGKPSLFVNSYIKSDWSAGMLFRHNIIMSKRDNDRYFPR